MRFWTAAGGDAGVSEMLVCFCCIAGRQLVSEMCAGVVVLFPYSCNPSVRQLMTHRIPS